MLGFRMHQCHGILSLLKGFMAAQYLYKCILHSHTRAAQQMCLTKLSSIRGSGLGSLCFCILYLYVSAFFFCTCILNFFDQSFSISFNILCWFSALYSLYKCILQPTNSIFLKDRNVFSILIWSIIFSILYPNPDLYIYKDIDFL